MDRLRMLHEIEPLHSPSVIAQPPSELTCAVHDGSITAPACLPIPYKEQEPGPCHAT